MKTDGLLLLYVPCGSLAEAKKIGRTLVDEKLAVCVNVVPCIYSIFRESQKTKSVSETLLLAKVLKRKKNAVQRRIQQLHSYVVPCICLYSAVHVNQAYLRWARQSSR